MRLHFWHGRSSEFHGPAFHFAFFPDRTQYEKIEIKFKSVRYELKAGFLQFTICFCFKAQEIKTIH